MAVPIFLVEEATEGLGELDPERCSELQEDIYDALVVQERADEKRESWETVKKRLAGARKLRA